MPLFTELFMFSFLPLVLSNSYWGELTPILETFTARFNTLQHAPNLKTKTSENYVWLSKVFRRGRIDNWNIGSNTQFVTGFQPSLLRHLPLEPDCNLFIFLPLFSVPPTFKVFQTVSPTLMQPPTALIQPTNLSWFKQISKGQFYQFNCCFLSKINF